MQCWKIIIVCSQIHTKDINTLCGKNVQFLGAFAKFRKANNSFVMSIPPFAWNNWAPTGRILMKFGISVFFENLSTNFTSHNRTTITILKLKTDIYIYIYIYIHTHTHTFLAPFFLEYSQLC